MTVLYGASLRIGHIHAGMHSLLFVAAKLFSVSLIRGRRNESLPSQTGEIRRATFLEFLGNI